MVNKLIVSVLVILMLLGIGIYFRVEFKYQMVSNGQKSILQSKYKQAAKQTSDNVTTAEDLIGAVTRENGISFAGDVVLADLYLNKACDPHCLSHASFYKNYKAMVESIIIGDMWISVENKHKDRVASYIYDREMKIIAKELNETRAYISSGFAKLESNDLKLMANETIQAIDAKMAELKKR